MQTHSPVIKERRYLIRDEIVLQQAEVEQEKGEQARKGERFSWS